LNPDIRIPNRMINKAREKTLQGQITTREIKPIDSKPGTPQKEYGGRKGKDPTRFGDWEKNGRCIDF